MFTQRIPICLALLILTAQTLAQCSAPGSLLCSASNAAADVVNADLDATDVSDGLAALDGAADVGIDPGEKGRFFRRQGDGSPSLCCSPDTECLSITGIPYCYDITTTGFTFANGSYGFLSNDSFYSADGSSLIDSNGDGSTETSSPAASAAAPTSPLASSSYLGTTSTKATPTGVANASHSPLASGTLAGKGAESEGHPTPSASGASSTSSVAGPKTSSNSAYQAGRQNGAAAAGFSVAWILWIFLLY